MFLKSQYAGFLKKSRMVASLPFHDTRRIVMNGGFSGASKKQNALFEVKTCHIKIAV